jgi:hypothetical protein
MALVNTYFDAYLKSHVTEERETRAASEVSEYGTFAAEWSARLTVIRAYVITCLECQAQPDDLFSQKLKNYRTEFDAVLAQARAETDDADGNPLPTLTVSLERA